jgi:glycerophosphoryl diester phosphodiesterase
MEGIIHMSIINYAHRGASAYYPENTLRAFYAGLDMGADGIETDIQRTKDGVLVLSHDDSLERVAGLKKCISELTYEELLDVDFGIRMGEKFRGERIARLDTFLTQFGRRGLTLALEIKRFGIEADCLKCVNSLRCRDDVIFTSFNWDSLIAMRKLDADIREGFLTWEITEETLDSLEKNHIRQICPIISKATPEGMALAALRGISVRFWGVNDTDLMRQAIKLGGDGMTINFPDKLALALKA